MSDRVAAIREKLYREGGGAIYVILDGASVRALRRKFADREPRHVCLYRGELQPDVAEVFPATATFGPVDAYLMEDESGAALLRFRLKNGTLAKQIEQVSNVRSS